MAIAERAVAALSLTVRGAACAALIWGGSAQVLAAGDTPATPPDEPPLGGSFHDDFDRFDEDRWYVSEGWTNGAHQNCTWSRQAIDVADGLAALEMRASGAADPAYICGEIQTNDRFGYGTFEARLRTGTGSGLNAAFFTYIGPVHGAPHDEIDFEVLTRDTGAVSVNSFTSGEEHHGTSVPLVVATDDAFHTYSFVWEQDRIRWFVDGVLVHEASGKGGVDLPITPQKIFLSHWSTDSLTDWMGRFDAPPPGTTLAMDVDWIAYTAPGDGCRFEGSVLCVEGAVE